MNSGVVVEDAEADGESESDVWSVFDVDADDDDDDDVIVTDVDRANGRIVPPVPIGVKVIFPITKAILVQFLAQ